MSDCERSCSESPALSVTPNPIEEISGDDESIGNENRNDHHYCWTERILHKYQAEKSEPIRESLVRNKDLINYGEFNKDGIHS